MGLGDGSGDECGSSHRSILGAHGSSILSASANIRNPAESRYLSSLSRFSAKIPLAIIISDFFPQASESLPKFQETIFNEPFPRRRCYANLLSFKCKNKGLPLRPIVGAANFLQLGDGEAEVTLGGGRAAVAKELLEWFRGGSGGPASGSTLDRVTVSYVSDVDPGLTLSGAHR